MSDIVEFVGFLVIVDFMFVVIEIEELVVVE